MGRIRILPDRVANQIAAGEVVERPASVCKELIENSLDAAATQLRIELKAGGRSLVKVTDNGSGMNRDDAMLAFERHATSKLRSADDLQAIATLGFRGEALPSIASVSRLTLETRSADEEAGTVVEIHGGRMRDVREGALAPGTAIAARNLFFNVPARAEVPADREDGALPCTPDCDSLQPRPPRQGLSASQRERHAAERHAGLDPARAGLPSVRRGTARQAGRDRARGQASGRGTA